MEFYVYVLIDGNTPFYVGKGKKDRMYEHLRLATKTNRKSLVLNKIRQMVKNGRKIKYEIVFQSNDAKITYEKEKYFISKFGRRDLETGTLFNLTGGGEGVVDYKWTDEHRSNLSKSIKLAIKDGRFDPSTFDQTDPSYRKRKSNIMNEYWNSKDGETAKLKLSNTMKTKLVNNKRVLSDEARRKMSDGGKKYRKHKIP